jgi:hypothetical protein
MNLIINKWMDLNKDIVEEGIFKILIKDSIDS